MRLLLAAGADVEARMVTEPAPIVPEGTSQAAAFLFNLRRPSQVPSPAAVPHQTALHGAAARGFTAFVRVLVENGADVQAKDANGRTPLELARSGPEPFTETIAFLESVAAASPR
jgi:ankyrin repeat protein